MWTSRGVRSGRFIGLLVIIFGAVCHPPNLDAKAWLNGHIVEIRPNGFLLQTRSYSIAIHTGADTRVRCKKQSLSLTELEVQDLVTVEGQRTMTRASWQRKSLPTATGYDAGNSRVQNHVPANAEAGLQISGPCRKSLYTPCQFCPPSRHSFRGLRLAERDRTTAPGDHGEHRERRRPLGSHR